MKVFWLRLIVFGLLWTYEIVNSSFVSISILFFALALGLYFLLTVPNFLLGKYRAILIILGIHGYFFSDAEFMTHALILYLSIDASFRLEKQKFVILLLDMALVLILLSFRDDVVWEVIVLAVFIGFLAYRVNQHQSERNEQRQIYEELLGEYRMLKRLHIDSEHNARLKERTRIARDIHDSVGHRLTALIMKLEMLRIQGNDPAFDELKEMATVSLEDTRRAVKTLQADESEGIATVVHLIRKLEAESHLLVQFTLKKGVLSVPITNEMSVVLYRVIQEALTNIMRHGDTRDAHITLSKTAADDILFEISNPIHERKPFTMGFGLRNMQERVEEIDGSLNVYQTDDAFVVSGKFAKGVN